MAKLTPSMRKRAAILVVVVGSALIAQRVYSLASGDTAATQSVDAAGPTRARSPIRGSAQGASGSAVGLHVDRLDARQVALSERLDPWSRAQPPTPFDSMSWQAPAPKAPAAPRPPKPVAPAFAYAYLGALAEDGVRTAFFTQGDRIIAVKVGDTVDSAYRVDEMTDKQMKLTYLPLNETLVLGLGGRP